MSHLSQAARHGWLLLLHFLIPARVYKTCQIQLCVIKTNEGSVKFISANPSERKSLAVNDDSDGLWRWYKNLRCRDGFPQLTLSNKMAHGQHKSVRVMCLYEMNVFHWQLPSVFVAIVHPHFVHVCSAVLMFTESICGGKIRTTLGEAGLFSL